MDTFKRVLRYVIIGGIFAVSFIPFVVSNSLFFPFITGKNLWFRVLAELVFFSWVVLATLDARYRLRKSWFLFLPIAFTAVIAVADMFGVNPFKSFYSNFERMEGLITLLHLTAYFIVVSTVFHVEKLWKYFLTVTVGTSVIVAIHGLFQFAGTAEIHQGGVRLDASFGNATYLAVYMLVHIFLTGIVLFRYYRGRAAYIIGACIVALQFVILYNTATRGALLGLIGGVLLAALILSFERKNMMVKKAAWGTLAGVVLIVGGFLLVKNSTFVRDSQVLSRFASISLTETTTKSRFVIWNIAWKGFKERPVLGWGQENFNYVFNKHYSPSMYNQEQWFDRTHNVILDWLIAGGILGLAAYLALFGGALYMVWKKGKEIPLWEKALITGVLSAYCIHNFFVFDNLTSYILFFTLLAYIYTETHNEPVTESRMSSTIPTIYTVSAVALVVGIMSLYVAVYKPYAQGKTLIQAISPQSAGLTKNLEYFHKALAYNSAGTYETREQLIQVSEQVSRMNVSGEMKKTFDDLVREEMGKQLSQTPDDARYYLFYGSYLDNTGAFEEGIKYITRASELSPNKQTILFQLGSVYINNKQYDAALQTLKKAYELEPEFLDARINYALAAVYAGKLDLAKQLTENLPKTSPDDRLINIYALTKQFNKVLDLWKQKVEESPQNPQYRVSLAAAYLLIGDRTAAIAEIRKAIEIEPKFKTQGEQYIKQIQAGKNPLVG